MRRLLIALLLTVGCGTAMADDDGGRRTGNSGHVVMFGQPVAVIAEPLGMARQVEGVSQRLTRRASLRYGRKVEYGKDSHL